MRKPFGTLLLSASKFVLLIVSKKNMIIFHVLSGVGGYLSLSYQTYMVYLFGQMKRLCGLASLST